MMTLRFGIITCPIVQSIQVMALLLLVQIDESEMFYTDKGIRPFKMPLNNMVLSVCFTLHSGNTKCITQPAPLLVFFITLSLMGAGEEK